MSLTPANDLCYIRCGDEEGKFINALTATIPLHDMGVAYGRAVYEVIGYYNGALVDYQAHEDRLKRSMKSFCIPLFNDFKFLHQAIAELIDKNAMTEGAIYILVTQGNPRLRSAVPDKNIKPTIAISTVMHKIPSIDDYEKGISFAAVRTNWGRQDRRVKTTSMPDNSIANETAHFLGAKEALYIKNGIVTEGGSSNPFFVKNGAFYTHPADKNILHGTVRARFIQMARKLDITVIEQPLPLEEWLTADALFTCSTTKWGMIGNGIYINKNGKAIKSGSYPTKINTIFKQITPTNEARELIGKVRAEYVKFASNESEKVKASVK